MNLQRCSKMTMVENCTSGLLARGGGGGVWSSSIFGTNVGIAGFSRTKATPPYSATRQPLNTHRQWEGRVLYRGGQGGNRKENENRKTTTYNMYTRDRTPPPWNPNALVITFSTFQRFPICVHIISATIRQNAKTRRFSCETESKTCLPFYELGISPV